MIRLLTCLLLFVLIGCEPTRPSFKRIQFDSKDQYLIRGENEVYETSSRKLRYDTVRSDLNLAIDGISADYNIHFTEASIANDTLKVKIHQLHSYQYDEYLITVVNQTYSVSYKYHVDVLPKELIKPEMTLLKLNKLDFKKGDEVRGYTEFLGHNSSGQVVTLKGNFKFKIK